MGFGRTRVDLLECVERMHLYYCRKHEWKEEMEVSGGDGEGGRRRGEKGREKRVRETSREGEKGDIGRESA